ncbi:MAG: GTPase [Ruminococcaceae bacterium]|nr:GTPase [Oscillospiraceae bacterium]
MDVPVYLFTGFLESGKTKFIQETLEDERFNAGERTLLVLCEEGIEEYEPAKFSGKNIFIKTVDDKEDLMTENLEQWLKETRSIRVIIEYNGMWPMDDLYNVMPQKWTVYQEMMFADCNTFQGYNTNMRSLVYDKLKTAELVIFNRTTDSTDKLALHKIVRGVSRNNAIIYEYLDGSTEQDTIEDPLPFNLDADLIEIKDTDYALWYRDMMEELQKYDGKIMKFKGIVARDKKMDPKSFIIGRHVMTCCADDIQYAGLIVECEKDCNLKLSDWVILTCRVAVEKHKAYRGVGPVLHAIDYSLTSKPEEEVVTF